MKIASSILAADFGILKEEIEKLENAGADYLHIDVMDGKFVPNISFGFPVIEAVKKYTKLPLDIHLMIEQPERYIDEFALFEPEILTVHQESSIHLHRNIYQIKEKGMKAGVALNPGTAYETLIPVIRDIDLILFMSVNPGFGGQKFIPSIADKLSSASHYRAKNGLREQLLFEIDGGLNEETAKICKHHGVDIIVAGSSIFKSADYRKEINNLR